MTKKLFVFLFVLVTMLSMTLNCGAAGNTSDQVIIIGQNGIYDLNGAISALNKNAGNAVIYINGSTGLTQLAEIPSNLTGLKSVTLASYTGAQATVSMNGSVICANGVPVSVEQGVSLTNGFLVGGSCIGQPGKKSVDDSTIILNGSADFVIGGGLAMGSGAVSSVKNVNIIINGSANSIHGGGYAFNGGTADVSGTANLILTRTGAINNALYGGGYASGAGSSAPVAAAHVIALGAAGSVYQSKGLGEMGGNAAVGSYNIELINSQIIPTQMPSYEPGPTIIRPDMNTTTVMYIGPNQQAQNFTDAVNLLPMRNAGNVEFRIMGNFRQEKDVIIPADRGVLSLTVTGNNNTRMTVSWPEDVGFFANGIPTTIANSVVFKDGVIYGGANVSNNQYSILQSTYLDISGTVNKVVAGSKAKGAGADAHVLNPTLILRGRATGWLYGGGAALYGGYSAVDGTAVLNVTQGAVVELSVAGGGYAFGAGSQSVVKDSNLNIAGAVTYAVFLGGYADQSSTAITTGLSYLNLEKTGNVSQSVWYGGRAFNKSTVTLDTARAQISGRVGATVHREGRASDNGVVKTRVIQ